MQQADPQKSEDDDIHRLQLVACEELTVQIIHRPQRPPRVYFRAIGNETEVPDQFEDGPFNRVIGEFDVDLETEGAIQTADKIVERMWHYVLTPDTQIHVERMIARPNLLDRLLVRDPRPKSLPADAWTLAIRDRLAEVAANSDPNPDIVEFPPLTAEELAELEEMDRRAE